MADDQDEEKETGETDGEAQEEEGGKKSSKKLLIMIVVPLLLLGGGAAAYFTGALDSLLGGGEEQAAEGDHGDAAAADHGGGGKAAGGHGEAAAGGHGGGGDGPFFLAVPDLRVNLNSDGGTSVYLQLRIQLELKSEEDMHKVEAVMPRVIDQFQTYLRELRIQDLRGSAGAYRLKAELLNRVNAAAAPVEVQSVLYDEILTQEQ
ncbi:MAG: flagellar basal body-associated FliL family protein [Rhodospirillales bacterium]|nr:flagellar basal body-associated FliL family protein [Rhodospirillales bacterium]